MDEAEICNKVAIMDHGKIVAYDSPYNLEKKYTSNVTRIKVSNMDLFIQYLEANSIKYKLSEDLFKIYSTNIKDILSMVSLFKDSIADFETTKGTLNDVFLAVTGKEIEQCVE